MLLVCVAPCASAVLLVASCSTGGSDALPVRDSATDDIGFHFDAARYDYPDTPAGRVASRLGGCLGSEAECHGGTGNPAHLYFGADPEADLRQLVSVRSTERPDLYRIAPNDPAHSWMIFKLENDKDAGVEVAMPKGTDGDPELAALVRDWVSVGAPTSLDGGSE